jgi:hypothetical protein
VSVVVVVLLVVVLFTGCGSPAADKKAEARILGNCHEIQLQLHGIARRITFGLISPSLAKIQLARGSKASRDAIAADINLLRTIGGASDVIASLTRAEKGFAAVERAADSHRGSRVPSRSDYRKYSAMNLLVATACKGTLKAP